MNKIIERYFEPEANKVLIYGNRKIDDIVYDISTQAKCNESVYDLFTYLRKEWKVYSDLESTQQNRDARRCVQEDSQKLQPIIDSLQSDTLKVILKNVINDHKSTFSVNVQQLNLYEKAKTGDFEAMKELLFIRKGYEYETIRVDHV